MLKLLPSTCERGALFGSGLCRCENIVGDSGPLNPGPFMRERGGDLGPETHRGEGHVVAEAETEGFPSEPPGGISWESCSWSPGSRLRVTAATGPIQGLSKAGLVGTVSPPHCSQSLRPVHCPIGKVRQPLTPSSGQRVPVFLCPRPGQPLCSPSTAVGPPSVLVSQPSSLPGAGCPFL